MKNIFIDFQKNYIHLFIQEIYLIALFPLQAGGNLELQQDPVQSPLPLSGVPPPLQGMADNRCIMRES